MKKNIFFILFFILIPLVWLSAEDETYSDLVPAPYEDGEIPAWLMKVRRAEIVFVGSYPLSMLFTKLGMDFGEYFYHNFDSEYAPSILGGTSEKAYSEDRIRKVALVALAVSGCVTLADFIINEIKENKKERAKAALKSVHDKNNNSSE